MLTGAAQYADRRNWIWLIGAGQTNYQLGGFAQAEVMRWFARLVAKLGGISHAI
jgi:hypothetical protein